MFCVFEDSPIRCSLHVIVIVIVIVKLHVPCTFVPPSFAEGAAANPLAAKRPAANLNPQAAPKQLPMGTLLLTRCKVFVLQEEIPGIFQASTTGNNGFLVDEDACKEDDDDDALCFVASPEKG